MEETTNTNYTTAFWLLIILSKEFLDCNSKYDEDIMPIQISEIADASIDLATLLSEISLGLGRSLYIENGQTTFEFIAILELSKNNSADQLHISYDDVTAKTIVLNTDDIPQSYLLENGYNYVIYLKDVTSTHITFIYNAFRWA